MLAHKEGLLYERLKQVEEEKELLQTALNEIETGIHMVDKFGRTILYTKALEEIEQLKPETVMGKHISSAYQLDENSSILLKVLKTGIAVKNQQVSYLTSTGRTINLITNTYPIFHQGAIAGAISVNTDITKIKELEEKIHKLQRDLFFKQKDGVQNGTQFHFEDIISTSQRMKSTIEVAKKFAVNLSPILIYGETGTGKELLAQSIHNYSSRYKGPFVAINCAAIPETLLEGLLFGTCKGAFTGSEDRRGVFEEANDGTLFLDEINSMSLLLQTKLLRVLQTKTVRRLGGSKDIAINPRIVSAMNIDPRDALTKNQLRSDFYYRIAVATLEIPPLRDRTEDISYLTNYFIERNNKVMGKKIQGIERFAMEVLNAYQWPGNVRELEHTVEFAMNMTEVNESVLSRDHFPPRFRSTPSKAQYFLKDDAIDLTETLLSVEREIIIQSLMKNQNNVTKTAKELNLSRQRLEYRIKRLNINI
ncbi:MAG: sigma 54-interacting transcriptional regulator [Desulfitobacterium hafniense]|nr:sigma 54-interacting transcriptional regulator [Desulfitobacterium hafniense]